MKKNRIKIGLFPLHSFIGPGGVKSHVLALHKEFTDKGLQSKIIVPRRDRTEDYGREIILLGKSFSLEFNGTQSDLTIFFQGRKIDELLRKENFDILHFHNFGPHSAQILEKSKAVNVLTFHACLGAEAKKFFRSFPFILKIFNKKVNEKIHGIIGVAPFNLSLFKNFKGPKAVIPNGIDLKKFDPNSPKISKYLDGKVNILFVGRLEERKGLVYLLKAYKFLQKKFGNLRLIVVGTGKLEAGYKKWVRDNGLKEVIFEGEVVGEKIAPLFATCDIFCSPAIFGESFGIVLLEAMAMGKPVVAFANAGYRTVLVGKGSNFLAHPKDWRELARKLEILIGDKDRRQEMGRWGIAEVKKYDWPKIAKRVLDFYEKAIEYKEKNNAV